MGKRLVLLSGLTLSIPVVTNLQADNLGILPDLEYRIDKQGRSFAAANQTPGSRARTLPSNPSRPANEKSNPTAPASSTTPVLAASSTRQPLGEYMISPGDIISVRVFGEPDLSLSGIRVPTDGHISYPLLGQIRINNHTVRSLEQQLTALLRNGFLQKPKVSVSIVEYRPIFVKGGVNSPGAHDYAEGLTVEKALALAGGFSNKGKVEGIIVLRDSGTSEVVGLDYSILPGDVITVPEVAVVNTKEYIYLHGEVNSPGSYEYRKGLTVEKALALAGGFSDRASKRKIQISRENEAGDWVRLKKLELNFMVEPGDVITVGASLF